MMWNYELFKKSIQLPKQHKNTIRRGSLKCYNCFLERKLLKCSIEPQSKDKAGEMCVTCVCAF